MQSQKVSTNMIKRVKNDSGLNLCRSFKARPSMNRERGFYKDLGWLLQYSREINLVRSNNTVEPRYNEHGLYQIRRYRTLVADHKSTLCQFFCLLRTSNFKFFLKLHLHLIWPKN